MPRKRFAREGYERRTHEEHIIEHPPRPGPEEPTFPCPRCGGGAVERWALWERDDESAEEPVLWCPSCETAWWEGEELAADPEWDRLSVVGEDWDDVEHVVYERVPRVDMPRSGPR